jgi:hypothetical protein
LTHPALSTATDRIALDAWTGRRIRGGCDDCAAYQTLTRVHDGYYVLTVSHDPTSPELLRVETDDDAGPRVTT